MAKPAFLFAPGTGAASSHLWMKRWAKLLGTIGRVELMDYPYALAHRGRPDPMPRLIAAHREALDHFRRNHRGPIVLIGKSMGGRVGCHVSLVEKVHAVVCLGYPLCGGGDPAKMRDEVLLELATPVVFIQGTRDSLCPLPLLQLVREKMRAPTQLEVVQDGDHSLQVARRQLKSAGQTQESVERQLITVIGNFV